MARNRYAIFVAGGSGTRMGTETPKQFLLLGGFPILQRTIETFLQAEPDLKVIVALPKQHFQTWKSLCATYAFDTPMTLVAGGLTRYHSVRNALAKVPDGAVVAIHDGVRPLLSPAMVTRMFDMMDSCRALIPVMPVTDTLRSTDPAVADPDRSKCVAVQTPQIFLSEDIKSSYNLPYETSFTDDASVAVRNNIPLTLCEGERYNLKITTPEDLVLAEAILTVRRP